MSKFFDSMENFSAIGIGGGNIVVQFPSGTFEVAGVRFTVGYNGDQKILSESDEIFKINKFPGKLISYTDSTGNIRSIEEFEKSKSEMEEFYCNDSDEYFWPNLQVEFDVRSRCDWTNSVKRNLSEETETRELVTIKTVGVWESTGSKFISTPYQHGKAVFNRDGAIYSLASGHVAMDEVGKCLKILDEKEIKYELPNHGGCRFLKVSGKYVLTKLHERYKFVYDTSAKILFMNLEDAKKKEAEIRGLISSQILVGENTPDKATLTGLYSFLIGINEDLSRITVYTKSSQDKFSLTKKIREKILQLEKNIASEYGRDDNNE